MVRGLSVALAALTLAACSTAPPPASETAVPRSSMRAFGEEDVTALLLQDGDIPGATAQYDGPAGPGEEVSDAEWKAHLDDHGLVGRWWSSLVRGEGELLDYPFIIGGRVSLWADAEAALEALAFENSAPPPGTQILISEEIPELGDGGWCGVMDWGALSDRGWCRFAVANSTFDLYIRTGDQTHPELDPRATGDLAELALRVRQRAEGLATIEAADR